VHGRPEVGGGGAGKSVKGGRHESSLSWGEEWRRRSHRAV